MFLLESSCLFNKENFMSKNKRYETVTYRGVKGIRKDLKSGSFYVEKYIRGQRFNSTFSDIKDAADWKKNFHPSLALETSKMSKVKESAQKRLGAIREKVPQNVIKKVNGNDLGLTFSDIWELYKEDYLTTIQSSSMMRRLQDAHFYEELMNVKMVHFNADVISEHIEVRKKKALLNPKSRRFNFDNDLKNLKAVLNWYRNEYDEQFVSPILRKHYTEGVIRKIPKKKKKLKKHELLAFFEALEKDSLFWRDFAETQFFLSSRVQEPAGLLRQHVDLVSRVIEIENVMVWGRDKKFMYLKDSPKNGEDREAGINDRLFEIMQRRLSDQPRKGWEVCPKSGIVLELVFHLKGKPLSYRQIQYHYNKALKRAGLSHKYSSTHIMRHTMANMVRSQLGLDSAQAVGGWKTRDIVENVYTEIPTHIGAEARSEIEDFLYKKNQNPTTPTPNNKSCTGLKLVK